MFKGELLSVVLVLCLTAYLCLRAYLGDRECEVAIDKPDVEELRQLASVVSGHNDEIAKLQSQVSSLTLRAGINR